MPIFQVATLSEGKKCFMLPLDKNGHWYNFFSSLEVEDATWLEDALSLKCAFSDLKYGCLSSHEEVKAEMENYYGQNRMD